MKKLRRQITFGIGLVMLSALTYFIQIKLFRAERDTLFYLFQDLAFVPIQILRSVVNSRVFLSFTVEVRLWTS